jgi:hypothetical protein
MLTVDVEIGSLTEGTAMSRWSASRRLDCELVAIGRSDAAAFDRLH